MNTNLVVRIAVLVAFPALVLYAFLPSPDFESGLEYLAGVVQYKAIFGEYSDLDLYDTRDKLGIAADVVMHYALLVGFVFALIPSKSAAPVVAGSALPTPPGTLD